MANESIHFVNNGLTPDLDNEKVAHALRAMIDLSLLQLDELRKEWERAKRINSDGQKGVQQGNEYRAALREVNNAKAILYDLVGGKTVLPLPVHHVG